MHFFLNFNMSSVFFPVLDFVGFGITSAAFQLPISIIVRCAVCSFWKLEEKNCQHCCKETVLL